MKTTTTASMGLFPPEIGASPANGRRERRDCRGLFLPLRQAFDDRGGPERDRSFSRSDADRAAARPTAYGELQGVLTALGLPARPGRPIGFGPGGRRRRSGERPYAAGANGFSAFSRADQRCRPSSRRTTARSRTQLSCNARRGPRWADGRETSARCAGTPASCRRAGRFAHKIVEIVGTAQQPQPAFGKFPDRVHVEQQGDDLGLGVGVDAPVLAVAHRRAPSAASGGRRDRPRICPRWRGAARGRSTPRRARQRPAPYSSALDRVAAARRAPAGNRRQPRQERCRGRNPRPRQSRTDRAPAARRADGRDRARPRRASAGKGTCKYPR